MALILSIVGYKNQPLAQPRIQRFTEAEVTLGRAPQNSCVLSDPENVISKIHCIIRRRGSAYELADCSSNGTFLNSSPEPLGRDRTVVLNDGDRLLIGDYDILVQIAPEPNAAAGIAPARPAAARVTSRSIRCAESLRVGSLGPGAPATGARSVRSSEPDGRAEPGAARGRRRSAGERS